MSEAEDTLAPLPSAGGAADGSRKERLRRFTTHVFRKTPTAGHGHVLNWGWMMKQGEGGLLHRKTWKRRFFVLYKVPQGSVLVYYDKQSVSGDDILGFVDLRKAVEVKEVTKTVNKVEESCIEIVTASRNYYLCPESVNKTLNAPVVPKLQFILGWPVPEPAFNQEITAETPDGKVKCFNTWLESLTVQVKVETTVQTFEASVVADSTDTLPPHVTLRCTATDLALLDVDDGDQAHTCWSYRDVASWSCPIDTELHITVRIPAAMIRCVFKTDRAKEIKGVIETHIQRIVENQETGGGGGH
jgi:hypothetical protein